MSFLADKPMVWIKGCIVGDDRWFLRAGSTYAFFEIDVKWLFFLVIGISRWRTRHVRSVKIKRLNATRSKSEPGHGRFKHPIVKPIAKCLRWKSSFFTGWEKRWKRCSSIRTSPTQTRIACALSLANPVSALVAAKLRKNKQLTANSWIESSWKFKGSIGP